MLNIDIKAAFAIAALNQSQIRMLIRMAKLPQEERLIPVVCAKPLRDLGVLEILTDVTSERETVCVGLPCELKDLMECVHIAPLLKMAKRWFGSERPRVGDPKYSAFDHECLKRKRRLADVLRFIYRDHQ